jgi:hypothetical protein
MASVVRAADHSTGGGGLLANIVMRRSAASGSARRRMFMAQRRMRSECGSGAQPSANQRRCASCPSPGHCDGGDGSRGQEQAFVKDCFPAVQRQSPSVKL